LYVYKGAEEMNGGGGRNVQQKGYKLLKKMLYFANWD